MKIVVNLIMQVLHTVLSKNGAHVSTESIGETQASPSATPFRLLLMVPAF